MKSAYADDAELLSEDGQSLVKILEIASDILKDWSLFVNESNTAFTRLYLAETDALDTHGNKVRGDKGWRESVLLGSKLCSERDIVNRRNKANVAFYTYKKVWLNSSVQISESGKLKLYEALVTSVLLYNCSSWAAPETVMASVDVLHLRQIINTYWPTDIMRTLPIARAHAFTQMITCIRDVTPDLLLRGLRKQDGICSGTFSEAVMTLLLSYHSDLHV